MAPTLQPGINTNSCFLSVLHLLLRSPAEDKKKEGEDGPEAGDKPEYQSMSDVPAPAPTAPAPASQVLTQELKPAAPRSSPSPGPPAGASHLMIS